MERQSEDQRKGKKYWKASSFTWPQGNAKIKETDTSAAESFVPVDPAASKNAIYTFRECDILKSKMLLMQPDQKLTCPFRGCVFIADVSMMMARLEAGETPEENNFVYSQSRHKYDLFRVDRTHKDIPFTQYRFERCCFSDCEFSREALDYCQFFECTLRRCRIDGLEEAENHRQEMFGIDERLQATRISD